jgi:NAD(P)-dependent dehydrogenase (short-subunit alcohol dehydrogenase family)
LSGGKLWKASGIQEFFYRLISDFLVRTSRENRLYHYFSLEDIAFRFLSPEKEDTMSVEKVAVVVAGGSGMGAAAAKRLAGDGFKVAILSSSGKGEALATELGGLGVTGSNQSNDDLQRLVDLTLDRWGRIDVLVNSGGHGPRAPILEITDGQWHTGLDIYLMNVVRPTRIVAPHMVKQKAGAIINISTAWVVEPSPMFPTSAVFRAGLAAYTKIFANTYAADNVRMNNVLPGWIDSLPATEERRDSVPMQRYGTSDEIAATIAFLASEGAGYITGQNIRVDGGIIRAI